MLLMIAGAASLAEVAEVVAVDAASFADAGTLFLAVPTGGGGGGVAVVAPGCGWKLFPDDPAEGVAVVAPSAVADPTAMAVAGLAVAGIQPIHGGGGVRGIPVQRSCLFLIFRSLFSLQIISRSLFWEHSPFTVLSNNYSLFTVLR